MNYLLSKFGDEQCMIHNRIICMTLGISHQHWKCSNSKCWDCKCKDGKYWDWQNGMALICHRKIHNQSHAVVYCGTLAIFKALYVFMPEKGVKFWLYSCRPVGRGGSRGFAQTHQKILYTLL